MARQATATAGQRLQLGSAPVSALPLTMACWFKANATSGVRVMMSLSRSDNNDDFYLLFNDGASSVSARVGNSGGSETATSSAAAGTGVWAHACGVFASTTSRSAYLNGGSKVTDTDSLTIGSAPNRTGIFHNARTDQDAVYDGHIAEVAIWNVALSDAEIASLGKGFSPLCVRPSALIIYVPIIGNDSPELNFKDASANFTISGTVAKSDHPAIIYPGGPI